VLRDQYPQGNKPTTAMFNNQTRIGGRGREVLVYGGHFAVRVLVKNNLKSLYEEGSVISLWNLAAIFPKHKDRPSHLH
jgi:hypothetical protein